MSRVSVFNGALEARGAAPDYAEPLRIRPPRKGLRPGTAVGDPQVLF